jgi:serine protease Do
VSRGWLGVNIQNVTEDVAKGLGMKEPYGAIVSGVTADGPAQKSGLKEGDAIIALNGDKVADSRDLARKIASMNPNASVDVKVIRDGAETVVKVGLGIFPGNDKLAKLQQGKQPGAPETEQLGLTLSANKPKTPGAKAEGVVVSDVENDSEAAQKGLRAGDVIVDVGGKVVSSVEEVVAGIKRAKELGRDAVLMRVRSGTDTNARFVGLSFKKAG